MRITRNLVVASVVRTMQEKKVKESENLKEKMVKRNHLMSAEKVNKITWFQWSTLAGIGIGAFIFLFNEIHGLESKMDNQTMAIQERIDQQSIRMDQQSERTDRLYQMFIDLLKDQKTPSKL
jgi:hypothetical protein